MSGYIEEHLSAEEDNGTMPANVVSLSEAVVGQRITNVETGVRTKDKWGYDNGTGTVITLDNGTYVELSNTNDCCAYTELELFLLNPDKVDHVITGVGTTQDYHVWHIYADAGDVLKLFVGWSPGNPFYYGYGFDIQVKPVSLLENAEE